ncbi:hypothetical protein [Sphingomonas turrisvirgatae]|uniref:XRE family transcriptional regulator n=1 Tax=Sphingomonas turrisvirgatae TaxID=1888892 RepID=A0A1E3LSG3_9SPHN|nr:hypothetical protein [Sphingomonas turrisvirgatae]ODP36697.1 hypothetical protein BFL28_05185 [Sphingomonas turrisvirgatae]
MAILGKVERYLREHGVAQTRFGRMAVGDPRLVGDLRNGRELRPATRERVEAFMAGAHQR